MRDSIYAVELEVEQSSGHLFAVVALTGDGGASQWVSYLSTDSGNTWLETYVHSAATEVIQSVSCTYWNGYFYVAHSQGSMPYLHRFRSDSGQQEDFSTGTYVTVGSYEALDLVLAAPVSGGGHNAMYLVSRTSQDQIIISRADLYDLSSWTVDSLMYWQADRGLDGVATDQPSYPFHLSCISDGNQMKVVQYDPVLGWSEVLSRALFGASPDMTSICADGPWLGCAFEYFGAPYRTLFAWSDSNGSDWWQEIVQSTDDHVHTPSVSSQGDDGIGIAYLHTRITYPFTTTSQFKWKPRDDSVAFIDVGPEPCADHAVKDSIPFDLEYCGGDRYGLVYVSDSYRAYFTLSEPVGCCVLRADVDHGGYGPDVSDLVSLVIYMFQDGPELLCPEEADIDGDGAGPDIADLIYLVSYMFQGGPDPVPCPYHTTAGNTAIGAPRKE